MMMIIGWREREEREMEEESSDGKPDFRFRISQDEELLRIEREQLSKKNLETNRSVYKTSRAWLGKTSHSMLYFMKDNFNVRKK